MPRSQGPGCEAWLMLEDHLLPVLGDPRGLEWCGRRGSPAPCNTPWEVDIFSHNTFIYTFNKMGGRKAPVKLVLVKGQCQTDSPGAWGPIYPQLAALCATPSHPGCREVSPAQKPTQPLPVC